MPLTGGKARNASMSNYKSQLYEENIQQEEDSRKNHRILDMYTNLKTKNKENASALKYAKNIKNEQSYQREFRHEKEYSKSIEKN